MTAATTSHVSSEPCTWDAHEVTEQYHENGEPIRPGWYITAVGPDDPEDVYAEIFIDFAVRADGLTTLEDTARRLADLLNRDEQSRA
jgi:hypothetical protein